ncbi:HAD family hydrolase [Vibrio sp. FNV 38]|nr:HAD family hydrolase [Vibrio sp. FNV 38]
MTQTPLKELHIFDMDETLIAQDLSVLWHQHLVDTLQLADAQFVEQDKLLMADYYQGAMDLDRYVAFSLEPLARFTTIEIDQLADQFVQSTAAGYLYPQARELIDTLQQQGKACMIISATVTFLVRALARFLGVPFAEGVNLVEIDNHYTGRIEGVPSYQSGKVIRLQQWLETQNEQYQATHFYSDSINDLPLLLAVPNPVVVNGCPQLLIEAKARDWPQKNWSIELNR